MKTMLYTDFLNTILGAINQEREYRKLPLIEAGPEPLKEVEDLYRYMMNVERDWDITRRRFTFIFTTIIPCDETHIDGFVTKDSGFFMMEMYIKAEEIFDLVPGHLCTLLGDRMICDAADMYACGEISKEKFELVRPYNPGDADKYLKIFKKGMKVV